MDTKMIKNAFYQNTRTTLTNSRQANDKQKTSKYKNVKNTRPIRPVCHNASVCMGVCVVPPPKTSWLYLSCHECDINVPNDFCSYINRCIPFV